MRIYSLHGTQTIKDYFEPVKQKSPHSANNPDYSLKISDEARNYGLKQPLQILIERYLHKIDPIREEEVMQVKDQVDEGYEVGAEKQEVIANQILSNFGI